MSSLNPEFVKNCWLQLSPHRLIATPLILGLAVLLAVAVVDRAHLSELLGGWLAFGAFAFACLGGVYVAAQCMVGEFVGNTWDQQRLSPLSPWSLTWGKVLGGAVYMWYAAGLQVALLLLLPWLLEGGWTWTRTVQTVVGLIGFALFCQALGLLTVLGVANAPDRLLRYRRNFGVALVLLVAFVASWLWRLVGGAASPESVLWWGERIARVPFWLATVWVFAGWALFGAYRLMREQKEFRNGPLGWLAFNGFLAAFFAGFVAFDDSGTWRPQATAWTAYAVVLTLCYGILFQQPTSPLTLRRLGRALIERQWAEVPRRLPPWTLSYGLAALVAVAAAPLPDEPLFRFSAGALPFALLLFAARDLGLAVGFTLGRRPQRALVATAVYLALLYGLFPALLDAFGADALLGLFWPVAGGEVRVWPAAVEAVGVWGWAIARGRESTLASRP